MALRRRLLHALAPCSTTVVASHLCGRSALIEKDQLFNFHLTYRFSPSLPPPLRLFRVLLLGMERFFLRGNPI